MLPSDNLPQGGETALLGRGVARPLALDFIPEKPPGMTGPPRTDYLPDAEELQTKPKGGGGTQPKTVEITVAATFDNPWSPSLTNEIAAMKGGTWEPSTDDFTAVAGSAAVVDSYLGVLGAILVDGGKERAKKTISRLNIFTHANSNLIALKGTVTPGTLSTTVSLEVASAFSTATLASISSPGAFFTVPSTNKALAAKKFTLDDVRERFTGTSALMVLYACHSGVDGSFIQTMADTFQVTVRGFKDVIGYCPKFDENVPSIDRKHVTVGRNNCGNAVTDFHKLDTMPNITVIDKTPAPPTP
jgi:hypothetical protein